MIETTNENLNINKLVAQKKEMIFVESDMIVPDSKPDILKTVNTSGTLCIYKKEIQQEKIKIDGSVNTYIMYLPENGDDNIRGINTNIDFSQTIDMPKCNEDMMLNSEITIKTIDCKVINGRKIGIKVGLEINAKVYSNEEISIINGINNQQNIQLLEKTLNVNSLVGNGSTKAYVKDTITLDMNDNLAEILKSNISLVDRDIKISYNKILAKAEAEIKIVYLTEDNKINNITSKIPVVGFIDMQNVNEENICDTNYEIKNLIIKPNNVEEHSIYVELEVEITSLVFERKDIKLIQDIYSPFDNITFNTKTINMMSYKSTRSEICNIRENMKIPEMEKSTIIDVDIKPIINKENTVNTRIIYEGELEMKFIFLNDTNKNLDTKIVKLPIQYTINNIDNCENKTINTNIDVANQEFSAQENGNVSCNVDLIFNANIESTENINVLDNLNEEKMENLEDYSLIIYVVKKGDTLWEIAKKFRSTTDDIIRANGIEDVNNLKIGQKLYIPRYTKKGVKSTAENPAMMNYA